MSLPEQISFARNSLTHSIGRSHAPSDDTRTRAASSDTDGASTLHFHKLLQAEQLAHTDQRPRARASESPSNMRLG
jgi:hypothetical protein